MRKGKNIIVMLIILLALSIGYIAFDAYSEFKQQEQFSIYQQGAQFGYEQAVTQLFQQLVSCQSVPVFYNNQTINAIAVECLQSLE